MYKYEEEQIMKIPMLMFRDYANPPTTNELCQNLGMSKTTLREGFKRLYGTTIYNYYRKEKLSNAKMMLEKSGMTISDVSLHCGYRSLSHFSSMFKEEFGITPLRYRKNYFATMKYEEGE
ncbi:AraC-like DNA-binding protein [Aequitasia blattaphilus]|uniref:AraC family transcriptional regulator n=1 Tax=Aequitasia blattaphilus TaxID=2949332 RepID=A0ABT1E7C0_9FIRM|nr:AraC family transcriptional regulator [Aequitasia blattaphilus]MCP1101719.1 AraC family transcriptional regulator [Aequitasia blattaphilus]MCR8614359.1 AraC family transcriptional regulator [Aequitasia blattaphilus]